MKSKIVTFNTTELQQLCNCADTLSADLRDALDTLRQNHSRKISLARGTVLSQLYRIAEHAARLRSLAHQAITPEPSPAEPAATRRRVKLVKKTPKRRVRSVVKATHKKQNKTTR